MNVLRNGMFAMAFLLLGGCMMMDMHGPHGAPMETTNAGSATESKDASRKDVPAADKEREMKPEHNAPHSGYPSGMAILGGALMVVMMLAMLL